MACLAACAVVRVLDRLRRGAADVSKAAQVHLRNKARRAVHQQDRSLTPMLDDQRCGVIHPEEDTAVGCGCGRRWQAVEQRQTAPRAAAAAAWRVTAQLPACWGAEGVCWKTSNRLAWWHTALVRLLRLLVYARMAAGPKNAVQAGRCTLVAGGRERTIGHAHAQKQLF